MVIRIVLASASPARLATLQRAGVEPEVVVSGVDEGAALERAVKAQGPLAPSEVPLALARAKAERVVSQGSPGSEVPRLVLGCDSVLELDGEVHGKPGDRQTAIERWHRMRGRAGILHTGHWVVDRREPEAEQAVGGTASTTVHFADLSDEEILDYVETEEPLQVAGAFTVDGLGGPYVTRIEGDYHAVVGVSLPLLRDLLAELGVAWHELRTAG